MNSHPFRVAIAGAVAVVAALALAVEWPSAAAAGGPKKPELVMKANPIMSFPPAKVRFTVDLKGGSDDYEDFYCPTVEWVWDDDTRSESTPDCDPYQAGRSEIKRHYTMEHVYRIPDTYRPEFRLKRKDKVLASVTVQIEVQSGLVH